MLRRTKIVATLGPATDDKNIFENLILAGVDVVRINCSHGNAEDRIRRVELTRETANKLKKNTAVLFDLQGPKIRIARFKNKKIELKKGDEFILDINLATDAGDEHSVGVDYKELINDVNNDDLLLLDDGRIVLKVKKIEKNKIYTIVQDGGILSNNKGINRFGGGLTADAITDKDKEDIKLAAKMQADYIALSFPRSAEDIHYARKLAQDAGSDAAIIAKIERKEAIDNMDEIIEASDAIMVARGDLGVEIGDAELPAVQKQLIHRARALNKVVITATQMMESMIENSIPTRAEVFDVANAVLDGTDAVMLSAETATGNNPVKVVDAMARICIGAEKSRATKESRHRLECFFEKTDEAIAMSAMYMANHANVKAIIAFSETGTTARYMSRIRSGIPIYGYSSQEKSANRMNLYRGVYPIKFDFKNVERGNLHNSAIKILKERGDLDNNDWVIITLGEPLGVAGSTNSMQVLQVGEILCR